MPRQQAQIKIPQKYNDNEAKGLCKVCGKSKEEFEKGRSKYCGEKCYIKYQKCFLYWSTFRLEIIKKSPRCKIEGCKNEDLEVDHIIPVAITLKVFDKKNCQVLCNFHHKEKTKKDLKKIKNHRNNQSELDTLSKRKENRE